MSGKRRCCHKPAKPVAAYPVNFQGRLGVQDAAGMAAPLACSRPYGGQLDMDLERVRDDFPLSTCPGVLVLNGLGVFVTGEFCRAQAGRIGTIRTLSNRNPRITLPRRWYRNGYGQKDQGHTQVKETEPHLFRVPGQNPVT